MLHALREIMRGARDSVRETVQPEMPKVGGTLREQQEQFRETFRNLTSLDSSSFNPALAVVSDDGQGNLTPNWRGIGAIGINMSMGLGIARLSGNLPRPWRRKTTEPSVGEKPNAMEPIHLGPKKTPQAPTASGKPAPTGKAPEPDGLFYDGETKQVRHGEKIIPDDQVAEVSQRLQTGNKLQETPNEVDRVRSYAKVVDTSAPYPLEKLPALARYLEKRNVQIMETPGNCYFQAFSNGSGVLKINRYATKLQVLHELCHYLDFKKIGFKEYAALRRVEREMMVLQRLKKNRLWRTLDEVSKQTSIDYAKDPDK